MIEKRHCILAIGMTQRFGTLDFGNNWNKWKTEQL